MGFLTLYEVYNGIVQSLMYSLDGAAKHLRRDGDPQNFDVFLNKEPRLKIKDLEILRLYNFNLHQTMLDEVATYEDSHLIGIKRTTDHNGWYPVFIKKNSVYDLSKHVNVTMINEEKIQDLCAAGNKPGAQTGISHGLIELCVTAGDTRVAADDNAGNS